jgi:hypothetical protein
MSRVFNDSAGLFQWRNNTRYSTEDIKAVVDHVIADVTASGLDPKGTSIKFLHGVRIITLREGRGTFSNTLENRGFDKFYSSEEGQLLVVPPSIRSPEFLFAEPSRWGMSPLEVLASSNGGGELPGRMVQQFASGVLMIMIADRLSYRWRQQGTLSMNLRDVSAMPIRKGSKMGPKVEDGMKKIRGIRQAGIAGRRAHKARAALWVAKTRAARLPLNGADIKLTEHEMWIINEAYDLLRSIEDRCQDERDRLINQATEV